ncbi:hypothetical protein [Luteibacter aegosomatissinici]|uniref:hypothetical protein n=1 Tax=Luteibacter aegosomatissinici TaxID=2911539 RepID=UPI001FFB3E03|nr:hypothetical protein [Luteibacter aegosomatissinici]UPG96575.1 hypothetical protein L2Y97_10790 [Luteibacter aegosomatissinici]
MWAISAKGIRHLQQIRRCNLSRILTVLEVAGVTDACAHARLLGNAVTARKLNRMMFASPIGSLAARAVEHAAGLPLGWMDSSQCKLPSPRTLGPAALLFHVGNCLPIEAADALLN